MSRCGTMSKTSRNLGAMSLGSRMNESMKSCISEIISRDIKLDMGDMDDNDGNNMGTPLRLLRCF